MAKPANMQGMSTDAPDRGRNPDNEADDRRNGPTSAPSRPAEEERETLLQAELQGIQNINHVIEGVVDSLERAKQNMEVVSRTVTSASTLLNTWIRILSQTEHSQRLILNPAWRGASQDLADIENESILRQQAAERREIEEQQRREAAAARQAEEAAAKRRAESAASRRSGASRGRGRSVGRGTSSTSGGPRYGAAGGQATAKGAARGGSAPARSSSNVGRGTSTARGRGRGRGTNNT